MKDDLDTTIRVKEVDKLLKAYEDGLLPRDHFIVAVIATVDEMKPVVEDMTAKSMDDYQLGLMAKKLK